MVIKQIFDEISAEPGSNMKMAILGKYKDNKLLEKVLYLAKSKRIKFYIKQIPDYPTCRGEMSLDSALESLSELSDRKVTGHSAIGFLVHLLSSVSTDNAYVIERIIEKDLKIGMGTSNINEAYKVDKKDPNLIEETNYMGAKSFCVKLVGKILDKGLAVSQLKADGRYCAAILRSGDVELESRSGESTILTSSKIISELITLGEDVVFTGELTMKNISSKYVGSAIRTVSNGIIASLVDICSKREERGEIETNKKISKFEEKHSEDFENGTITFQEALNLVIYTVWDCVSVEAYYIGKSNIKYKDRLKNITDIITSNKLENVHLIESVYVKSSAEAFVHFKEIMNRGLEGTILKTLDDGWRDGKPNFCVKLKLEMEVDLVITGFNYGTKGTKNENVISSFNAESSCGKLKTRPQGLDEKIMFYITENQKTLLNTIISVKCNGVSKPKNSDVYALMYPSFLEFRKDEKQIADSIETILEIERAAIELASI